MDSQFMLDAGAPTWNDHYVGVLKNGHSRYPKAYIAAALKGKASGTQIVLTATVDGVDLVAVGWKQNRESNLFFIMTRGLCSTRPDSSKPHVQTWIDANGNRCDRAIPQPEVASLYFEGNNVIDVHNQNRQGTLALEKKWQTQDCWFRLFTTLVGMCTVDALQMLDYIKPARRGDEDRREVLTFAALLAMQLLENEWDGFSENASNATPTQMLPPPPRLSANAETLQRPQSAPARAQMHAGDVQCTLIMIEDVDDRYDKDKRKPCHVCYKEHGKKVKSPWWCPRCRKGICGRSTGRGCFDTHARMVSGDTVSESIPETGAEAPQATRRAREVL